MSLKFGTSGLRGLSVDLMGPASFIYPTAFAQHLFKQGLAKSGGPFLVGYDFRASSPVVAKNTFDALNKAGLTPVDCGALPTPALAYYGLEIGAASIMVTGSHIPADRNGLKFYRPDGEIDKADEVAIGAEAAALMDMDIQCDDAKPTLGEADAVALFIARNKLILKDNALSGRKIGVYQHSTVARDLLVTVLRHYGAEVLELGRSDEFIPVDTEAVSLDSIIKMQGWAKEFGLDAIVSADGDGDRPLLTDETGRPVKGDVLGLITARFLGATAVVTPVTSNSGMEKAAGGRVIRTRVGSPYVIAGMQQASADGDTAIIGFEANGGTLTGSDFTVVGGTLKALPTRDCFLPLLAVLGSVADSGKMVSDFCRDLQLPVTAADRLENFPVEKSVALMAWLKESDANLSAFMAPLGNVDKTETIDGLRVFLTNGAIIHLRPSGNAPEMRCYVETKTDEDAQQLLKQGLARIAAWEIN